MTVSDEIGALIVVFAVLIGWVIGSFLGSYAFQAGYYDDGGGYAPPTAAQIRAEERQQRAVWLAEYRLIVRLEKEERR